ncbi:MAG: inositol monophosphatase [Puniceicoccales bacterium]|jgi:myo-inositol-1(or 4)-monophosphatase|nr:inositol monophosphatase [Puniceicoccales bacterium]
MPSEIIAYHQTALEAARAVATVLFAGADRTVNFQSARDVKLQADIDSEQVIREKLALTGLPIIGEEFGGDATLWDRDELYWVVDPLDGTYNYLRNQPSTCVSIALMRGRAALSGVVHDFCGARVYEGVEGRGVSINGVPLKPVWAQTAEEGCLMTGFPALADMSAQALTLFVEQAGRFKKVRMIGSAALAVAYVGTGQADVYYENCVNLWDVAAGMALVRAAGGFTELTFSGTRPLCFNVWAAGRKEWMGCAK